MSHFLSWFTFPAFPGQPSVPKIVSAFKDCINLAWTAPTNTGGTNLLGYNVEKRKNGSNLWSFVNPLDEPIKGKTIRLWPDNISFNTVTIITALAYFLLHIHKCTE